MSKIITFLTSLLVWFNANKIHIGGVLVSIAQLITLFDNQVVVNIWGVVIPLFVIKILSTINWIGVGLTTTGVAHWAIKNNESIDNSPKPNSVSDRISQ